MKDDNKVIWFKAKNYGWGWYPATWQGWLGIIVWLYLVFFITKDVDKSGESFSGMMFDFILPLISITVLLILFSYGTGEKPEWRWGGRPLKKE